MTTPPSTLGPPEILPQHGAHRANGRRDWRVPALVAVVVVLLAGLAFALTRGGSHQSPQQAARPVTTDVQADATGPSVVTPAMATAVVRRYWPAHERAFARRDLAALARLSAGPARQWEQAEVGCGCRAISEPRPMLAADYYVPRQAKYPASFVAAVQTATATSFFTEVLVFTKSGPKAQWLVTENSTFALHAGGSSRLDGPASTAGGFDQPVSAAQHRRAESVAAEFAALWQETKDSADIPADTGFNITGQTQDRLGDIAAYEQDGVQANGLLGHFSFYVAPTDRLVEVAMANGDDLACQPVRETVDYRPRPGGLIYQDPARHNWGPKLRSGYFHEVITRDAWQTCFRIPADITAPVEVLNSDEGGAVPTGT